MLVRDDWCASVVGRQCVVGDNHGALCGEVMLRGCVERFVEGQSVHGSRTAIEPEQTALRERRAVV